MEKEFTEEEFTEKDYYLHRFPYEGALEILEEEIKRIEESGKKTLWYYSGRKTLQRLKEGKRLIEKGRREALTLTPYDMNNIVYALLRKLES